ncbi:MAG: hypothetical protein Q7J34_14375 [Bacteroidales bacterium]|nr:hypothetical protein [Bacteroidales bacterium]
MKNRYGFFFLFFCSFTLNVTMYSQEIDFGDLVNEKVYRTYDEAFEDLWNCRILDFSYQNIGFLSERISKMENLEVLNLKGNPVIDYEMCFDRRYFGSLKGIRIVDIQENQLNFIPKGLSRLPLLQALYLGNNKIREIPDFINALQNLQILSLHHNNIRRLNDSIKQLNKLEIIDLSYNNGLDADEVFAKFSSMPGLKRIYLSGCGFKNLPVSISGLLEAEHINLSDNALVSPPQYLFQLIKLKELYLSKNGIREINKDIGYMEALEVLVLDNNELSEMPPAAGTLGRLTYLDLSANKFKNFPDSLCRLPVLAELRLANNQIVDLTPWIGELTTLKILDLSGNRIKELPEELARIGGLKLLILKGNPISREEQKRIRKWLLGTKILF